MSGTNGRVNWPVWENVRVLGRGSFGTVYEIQRDVFGRTEYAALKVISIPKLRRRFIMRATMKPVFPQIK